MSPAGKVYVAKHVSKDTSVVRVIGDGTSTTVFESGFLADSFAVDAGGNLWVNHRSEHGLVRYNPAAKQSRLYSYPTPPPGASPGTPHKGMSGQTPPRNVLIRYLILDDEGRPYFELDLPERRGIASVRDLE